MFEFVIGVAIGAPIGYWLTRRQPHRIYYDQTGTVADRLIEHPQPDNIPADFWEPAYPEHGDEDE